MYLPCSFTLGSNSKPGLARPVLSRSTFRVPSPSEKLRPTHTHCSGRVSHARCPQACLLLNQTRSVTDPDWGLGYGCSRVTGPVMTIPVEKPGVTGRVEEH